MPPSAISAGKNNKTEETGNGGVVQSNFQVVAGARSVILVYFNKRTPRPARVPIEGLGRNIAASVRHYVAPAAA